LAHPFELEEFDLDFRDDDREKAERGIFIPIE
jgi:hypothetical protein